MRLWAYSGFLAAGMVSSGALWGQSIPVRVSGGVMAGQISERVDPIYPPIARAAKVSGTVVLRAIVDETGHTTNLQVLAGPEMLRASAMVSVRRWVFRPYLLNGVATAVDTVVTVNFQLGPPANTVDSTRSEQDSSSQELTRVPLERDEERPPVNLVQPADADTSCGSVQVGGPSYHLRVSSGVMLGLLVKRVDPPHRVGNVSGAVVLRVCLDAEGAVEKAEAVSGPEALREGAIEAASQWRYRPFLLNGVAVPVVETVTIVH